MNKRIGERFPLPDIPRTSYYFPGMRRECISSIPNDLISSLEMIFGELCKGTDR